MATIRDVARLAKCSTATVSRFFNQKYVSPDAEQRIRAAIDALAFSPNVAARNLKLKRSMIVGLIITDIAEPFFPAVAKGVEDVTRAQRYSLMLFDTQEDEEREAACIDILLAHQCDGLLVIKAPPGPQHERFRAKLATLPTPVVYVDRAPDIAGDAVLVDNLTGARRGVEHLVRLGHEKIAIVLMGGAVPTHQERLEGYLRALAEHGLEPRAGYVQQTHPTVADAYSVTLQMLALPDPPTAIFATNARLTVGVMSAIQSRGLRCPADISVLGHDGFEWQTVFEPRLTIVEQPAYLMGMRAADLLIQRITGSLEGPARRIVLSPQLVVRESCGVYRGHPGAATGEPQRGLQPPSAGNATARRT
jgi:DNA-binding LacI/PurR family transcriptional regulator